jgi:hypothetical protein
MNPDASYQNDDFGDEGRPFGPIADQIEALLDQYESIVPEAFRDSWTAHRYAIDNHVAALRSETGKTLGEDAPDFGDDMRNDEQRSSDQMPEGMGTNADDMGGADLLGEGTSGNESGSSAANMGMGGSALESPTTDEMSSGAMMSDRDEGQDMTMPGQGDDDSFSQRIGPETAGVSGSAAHAVGQPGLTYTGGVEATDDDEDMTADERNFLFGGQGSETKSPAQQDFTIGTRSATDQLVTDVETGQHQGMEGDIRGMTADDGGMTREDTNLMSDSTGMTTDDMSFDMDQDSMNEGQIGRPLEPMSGPGAGDPMAEHAMGAADASMNRGENNLPENNDLNPGQSFPGEPSQDDEENRRPM